MTKQPDPVVSAQVLLRTSSGERPRDADLTAAGIRAIVPAQPVVAEVRRALEGAGFDVGPVVGLSFSIAAKRSIFDSYFGVDDAGERPGDVPLDRLPARVRKAVAAITFPPPPDFGPGNF